MEDKVSELRAKLVAVDRERFDRLKKYLHSTQDSIYALRFVFLAIAQTSRQLSFRLLRVKWEHYKAGRSISKGWKRTLQTLILMEFPHLDPKNRSR